MDGYDFMWLIVMVSVFILGVVLGISLFADAPLDSVCNYLGGTVEGSVCIIDNEVVLTEGELK
jgi:hypothetical protein